MADKKKKTPKSLKRLKKIGILNALRLMRRKKNKHVIINKKVISYIDSLSIRTFDESLIGLWKESESLSMSHMQIDLTEASFIRFLIQMTGAKQVLEAGTFRGWSTAVIASALVKNELDQRPDQASRVITLQLREEEAVMAKDLWQRHLDPYTLSRIDMRMGNARLLMKDMVMNMDQANYDHQGDLVGSNVGLFDLIFIDADKSGYEEYLSYAKKLARKGGLIVLDNMLNAGLVATDANDNTTKALKIVNAVVFSDESMLEGFSPLIIPAWDGVVILIKN